MPQKLLDENDAASFLRITTTELYHLVASGQLSKQPSGFAVPDLLRCRAELRRQPPKMIRGVPEP